jgi:transposase-like protein
VFIESQQNQQKKKMGRPRKYDEDFRRTALKRMKAGEDVTALAGELGVSRPQLYRWRNEALGRKPEPRSEAWLKEKADERQRRRTAELERLVAFEAIREDLGNSYTITYYPQTNPNEGFRKISVEIVSDVGKKSRVQSRPGYRPKGGF